MGVGGHVAELPWPALRSLHCPSLQGWVFNVVPWLVAIPASLFSGFLSDHLISQGEPGHADGPGPCGFRLTLGGKEAPVLGVQLQPRPLRTKL